MNTIVKDIELKKIRRSKLNPRKIVKKTLKGSDLFESIKRNGIQHPIEVRLIGKNGQATYELLSGDRRLTIAQELKLKSVSAIVYVGMDDAEAYDKTHFENVGREDLAPMEQAQDAQNLMSIYKGDIKAVASKLSLTKKGVKMRLCLQNLSPEWQQALKTARPEDLPVENMTVHDMTIAHLELIARMEHHIQNEILGDEDDGQIPGLYNWQGLISVKYLKHMLSEKYTRILSGVPWDLEDESLRPNAGSCAKCKNRSDTEVQKELWDVEVEGKGKKSTAIVKCLDDECFHAKLGRWQAQLIKKAKEKHAGLRVVGLPQDAESGDYGEITLANEVQQAKKSDKDAFPVVVLNGVKTGKVTYAKLRTSLSGSSHSKQKPDKSQPKPLKERRRQLHGLRVGIVLSALDEFLNDTVMPVKKNFTLQMMSAMVAVFGGTGCGSAKDKDRQTVDILATGGVVMGTRGYSSKAEKADTKTIMWWMLLKDMRDAISYTTGESALGKEKAAKWIAELVAFDWDKASKQACEKKQEPKSWANVNEDGTPKGSPSPKKKSKKQSKLKKGEIQTGKAT